MTFYATRTLSPLPTCPKKYTHSPCCQVWVVFNSYLLSLSDLSELGRICHTTEPQYVIRQCHAAQMAQCQVCWTGSYSNVTFLPLPMMPSCQKITERATRPNHDWCLMAGSDRLHQGVVSVECICARSNPTRHLDSTSLLSHKPGDLSSRHWTVVVWLSGPAT